MLLSGDLPSLCLPLPFLLHLPPCCSPLASQLFTSLHPFLFWLLARLNISVSARNVRNVHWRVCSSSGLKDCGRVSYISLLNVAESCLFAICVAVALQLDCVGSVNEPCRAHVLWSSFMMAVCSTSDLCLLWGKVTKTVSSSEWNGVLMHPVITQMWVGNEYSGSPLIQEFRNVQWDKQLGQQLCYGSSLCALTSLETFCYWCNFNMYRGCRC